MNEKRAPVIATYDTETGWLLLDPADRSTVFGPVWSLAALAKYATEHRLEVVDMERERKSAPTP